MAKKHPKLDNELYEAELTRLQAELVEMQEWVQGDRGQRLVVIFEGRDAAGKGGAIKRITEYLNPRVAQVVALPAPTERQRTQWYFQRYIEHLPAAGEIRLFDRSWYNRAGVERVMGYCTPAEYQRFLRQCPIFERMLIDDGIMLRKYWFSVSDKEQEKRFQSRLTDPMRRWKLSPTDLESLTRWEEYSRAKDEMFVHTDMPGPLARGRGRGQEARPDQHDRRPAGVGALRARRPPRTSKFPKRPKGTGYRRTDPRLQQRGARLRGQAGSARRCRRSTSTPRTSTTPGGRRSATVPDERHAGRRGVRARRGRVISPRTGAGSPAPTRTITGLVLGEVDHGGGPVPAIAGVEDGVHEVVEFLLDRPAVGQRDVRARQDQGARHQRRPQLGEQGQGGGVLRHPDADGALLRVQHHLGRLAGRRQDERVRPGRRGLHDAEDAVVHLDVLTRAARTRCTPG